jgi:hypothetical protein
MTADEMKRMVGAEDLRRFYPKRFINHDAEDPDAIVTLGETELGEKVKTHRWCAEADLNIYVNINLVPMDGGHKSMGIGTTDYEGLLANHNPKTMLASDSYMDPKRSELADSGRAYRPGPRQQIKVFHIETALNNRMYGPAWSSSARTRTTSPSSIGWPSRRCAGRSRSCPSARASARSSTACRRPTTSSRCTPGHRAGAREDPGEELRAVLGAGEGPGRRGDRAASRTSARTT